MKYKLAGIALVLLIATPLYGQPIGVELIPPAPTTVISAQTLTVGYRVKYLDLSKWNKEVVFFKDDVTLEKLQGQIGNPFKITKLDVKERIYRDGEYWQDFLIHLKIIDEKKGLKIIPKLQFTWALKEAGEENNNLELEPPVESEEVPINYVTTIPEKSFYLDVRDGLKLGDLSKQVRMFRFVIPAILSSFFLLWIVLLARWIKAPEEIRSVSADADALTDEDIAKYVITENMPTLKQARRDLAKIVKRAGKKPEYNAKDLLEIKKELFGGLHKLLMAAIPGLNPGDTPSQIVKRIEEQGDSGQFVNGVYLELSRSMAGCWDDLERGESRFWGDPTSASRKINEISQLLKKLKWSNRFLSELSCELEILP